MRNGAKRTLSAPAKGMYGLLAIAVALLSLFMLLQKPSEAAPPPTTMNFQGRLADSSGNLMPDGLYNMQFRLFTVSSGGSAVWTETRENNGTDYRVQVTNGLFSTQLGEATPLSASLFNATNLYFEITMATPGTATCATASCATWETPMTPRQKLATSAYAFNSATLNGKADTDFGQLAVSNTWTGTNSVRVTSATAFRVQNAGGTTVLGVDTIGERVGIGTASPDAKLKVYDSTPLTYSEDTGATISRVQFASSEGSDTATFSQQPAQGNLLIAIIGQRDNTTNGSTASITNSGWTKIDDNSYYTTTLDRRSMGMFYKIAGFADPINITGSFSEGTVDSMLLMEFASDNTDGTFIFDVSAENDNGGDPEETSLSTGTTASTSQDHSLVIAGMVMRDTAKGAASWTNSLANNIYVNQAVTIQSAWTQDSTQGTKESTASWSSPADASAIIAAFNLVTIDRSPVLSIDRANSGNDVQLLSVSDGGSEVLGVYTDGIGINTDTRLNGNMTINGGSNGASLQVNNGNFATLTDGTGYMQVGATSGLNMGIDNNEIQVRDGAGGVDALYLQQYGGQIRVGTGSGGVANATLAVSNGTSGSDIFVLAENATEVLTIANGGYATFQNTTDSTTAFQIQNASADTLFSVDTQNSRVFVGPVSSGQTASAKLYFGDVGGGNNLWIGEQGGTDSDILELQGMNGIYLSTNNGNLTSFSLDSTGRALFQTNTNSATAFQVQNTGGSALLTTDSVNNRIQIGRSTNDATAIFFMLDQYDQATDPANSVNGAMYYNTSTNKFRCYQNGGWTDCIGLSGWTQSASDVYFDSGDLAVGTDTFDGRLTVQNETDLALAGSDIFTGTCSGTNWTGTNPYTHTSGSTSTLFCGSVSVTAGQAYEVEYSTTGMDWNENFRLQLGAQWGSVITRNIANGKQVITAASNGGFGVIPTSGQEADITIHAIRPLTASSNAISIKNESGDTTLEVRAHNSNTGVGVNALQYTYSGPMHNTALGADALRYNTSGEKNTALGSGALSNNAFGSGNTAIGFYALNNNHTGISNVALGEGALEENVDGSYNLAMGTTALQNNTYGSNNVALGTGSLGSNTYGYNNIALGQNSGNNITTGNRNIIIGDNVDAQSATANEQLTIGNIIFGGGGFATGTTIGSGNVGIGGIQDGTDKFRVHGDIRVGTSGSNGCLKDNGGGTITGTCSSDERFKQNVTSFVGALDKIANLQAVTYNYNQLGKDYVNVTGDDLQYGLIAQQVQTIAPELVSTDENGYLQVDYGKLPIYNTAAIGEQQQRVVSLEQRLSEAQSTITNLQDTVASGSGELVQGDFVITGGINVSGVSTLDTLVVSDEAAFNGKVTISGPLEVASITVNGKIITAGDTPTAQAGDATGVEDSANGIDAPRVTIAGNDTSGTISFTTGANTAAGELVSIDFSSAYGATPRVVFSPASGSSSKAEVYFDPDTATAEGFALRTDTALEPGQEYVFNYWIVE